MPPIVDCCRPALCCNCSFGHPPLQQVSPLPASAYPEFVAQLCSREEGRRRAGREAAISDGSSSYVEDLADSGRARAGQKHPGWAKATPAAQESHTRQTAKPHCKCACCARDSREVKKKGSCSRIWWKSSATWSIWRECIVFKFTLACLASLAVWT